MNKYTLKLMDNNKRHSKRRVIWCVAVYNKKN